MNDQESRIERDDFPPHDGRARRQILAVEGALPWWRSPLLMAALKKVGAAILIAALSLLGYQVGYDLLDRQSNDQPSTQAVDQAPIGIEAEGQAIILHNSQGDETLLIIDAQSERPITIRISHP
jgi:hypothetical protein